MTRGPRASCLVAALAGLILAAGCAVGPPSDYLRPEGDGATGRIGAVVVTNALLANDASAAPVVYRAGGSAVVRATIVNEGDAPDRLLTVGGPPATGGEVLGDAALPPRHALTTGYGSSVLPPGTTSIELRLTGLTGDVRVGLTYPVDFTFAGAGTLRLTLPVADPS